MLGTVKTTNELSGGGVEELEDKIEESESAMKKYDVSHYGFDTM